MAEFMRALTRRTFIGQSARGIGQLALGSMMLPALIGRSAQASRVSPRPVAPPTAFTSTGGLSGLPHFAPKAKRVLCLFQSGGMSHIDLFDQKPALYDFSGKELPPSVKGTQRVTGMTSGQSQFLVVPPIAGGKLCGKSGLWISDLMPHLQTVADELCIIKSLNTEAINHDPAVTFFGTGHQQPGRPTMGAWASYGLGSENSDLPGYICMQSGGGGQPLQSRYWGPGFLPAQHGAVTFRGAGDAVLYLSNPPGLSSAARRSTIDAMNELNRLQLGALGDPAIAAQIANYELAFSMQTSVPELMDLSKEPDATFEQYGAKKGTPSFAANCILARRLAERGARFIQLNHRDWDHHGGLPGAMPVKAKEVDQAAAALVKDLKQRGLLKDTLVVWCTEFGRMPTFQAGASGRDHNPSGFTGWLAGAGVKAPFSYGATDDYGFYATQDKVHIHDLHATILRLMGFDHEKLTYRHNGRDFRLTDVYGNVVKNLIA